MSVEVRVPTLGESVVEATVSRWLKQAGEPVRVGESLVELETDKVNVEVAADATGTLESVLAEVGATVHPGDVIGTVAAGEGATTPAKGKAEKAGANAAAATSTAAFVTQGEGASTEEVRATPLAERVAQDKHVDLSQVPASGPGGKVTRADVQAYANGDGGNGQSAPRQEPAPPVTVPAAGAQTLPSAVKTDSARPETRQRLSRRRLTIAQRLVEAQRTAAMLSTFNEVDMSAVMALRSRRRDAFKERHGVSLGFMSFFTKATIGALKQFTQINAELQGDELVLKQYYDIGIAIGDPEGLVVPVVRNADRLSFAEIEQAIAAYAKKSKEHALTLDDLRGGTFTITNGGVFGSLLSTPILNPPQVGILGMHKIQERPMVVNGEIVVRPMMYLALSYDHRVVDGREAVQFLVRIKELLEDPERLFLEG